MEHTPKENESDPETIRIGLVLMLSVHSFGDSNPTGSIGLVYQLIDEPDTSYACVLLESGDDLNLIETTYLFDTFISLGYIEFAYEYKGPFELMNDYELGVFTQFFEEANAIQ